jgi:hypothetical protein
LTGWPIVTLESPAESKSRDNLNNYDINYFLGLFRGSGECFDTASKSIYQNLEQSRGWAPWQVGEVMLPVPWIYPPLQSSRNRQGSVVTLADFTSSNNILESVSEF